MSGTPLDAGRSLVADDLAAVEALLAGSLASEVPALARVARHLLASGGKRVRPLLCLLAARCTGVEATTAVRVAAAAELVHAASLCHDDVLDAGEVRRGAATVRACFGDALSILLGDLCLVRAFTVLARPELAACGAALGAVVAEMAEGEVLQASRAVEGVPGDVAGCLAVAEAKTGALLGWCATVGGLVPAEQRRPLAGFGRRLGRVYQIVDDVLDLAAGERAGRPPGQDVRGGTLTVPLLLAVEAEPTLRARLAEVAADPAGADELLAAVRSSGALERARALAQHEAEVAVATLGELPPGDARTALADLARYAAERHG